MRSLTPAMVIALGGLCLTLYWTKDSIISWTKLIVNSTTSGQDDKSPKITLQGLEVLSKYPSFAFLHSCLSRLRYVPQVGIGLIPMKDASMTLSLCTAIFKNKLTASIPRKTRCEKYRWFFS